MQLNGYCLALLPLISCALASQAPKIKKNPKNVVAIADFPFGGDKKLMGNIVFTAKKGKVVNVHVDVTGLPKEGGPFYYHIHEESVPGDGDCEKVGPHFNPYDAPENCADQKDDSYCQLGDLSGKHGWIDATCFETKYNDPYLSLNKHSKSFIIGKSIVFHFANSTKFACADIELVSKLRLESLMDDYETYNNDDLKELETDMESYQLNEDYKELVYESAEAPKYEIFEESSLNANETDNQKTEKSSNILDLGIQKGAITKPSSSNFSVDVANSSYGPNNTNNTNATNQGTDFENGSPGMSYGIGLAAGLGAFVGLFL